MYFRRGKKVVPWKNTPSKKEINKIGEVNGRGNSRRASVE